MRSCRSGACRAAAVAVLLGVACGGLSARAGAAPPETLPLTRVRLYETGIGYFERSGRISDRTRLPIPAAHLDDALKTLVILDADKGSRLAGVRWATRVTEQLGRALARLPIDAGEALDFEALARSLSGSQVALQAGGRSFAGRLLQVVAPDESGLEQCLSAPLESAPDAGGARTATCVRAAQAAVLLLGDGGDLMQFGLRDIERIRPLHAEDANRLRAAFAAHPGASGARHELAVQGALSDRVTLGYVAEAPLFRTTYRLVLSAQGALLQAWALLHNDTDEDWSAVKVELVNGQPDSFLFPLAAPRYARRRLVTPANELPSVPQLLLRGADALWDEGADETIGMGGIGTIGHGAGGGVGSGAGEYEAEERASSLLEVGDLAAHAEANGTEEGALFRYALATPVDLPAHDSLLVPMLQDTVEAQRVSYFAKDASSAQSALLFHNTTRQTLPAGTVAIFEDGGFGGESAIERLTPGEQRLLPFGLDLDVELTREPAVRRETRKLCRFEDDELIEHFARVEELGYALRNRSRLPRSVYLALDVVNNAKVERADSVLVLEDGAVSAVLRAPPESLRKTTLRVTQGLERRSALPRLTTRALSAMARDPNLPEAQRSTLEQASQQLLERDRRVARTRRLSAEIELLVQKTVRARKSLPLVARADADRGSALAAELVRSETRLAELERARSELDSEAPVRAARAILARLNE